MTHPLIIAGRVVSAIAELLVTIGAQLSTACYVAQKHQLLLSVSWKSAFKLIQFSQHLIVPALSDKQRQP